MINEFVWLKINCEILKQTNQISMSAQLCCIPFSTFFPPQHVIYIYACAIIDQLITLHMPCIRGCLLSSPRRTPGGVGGSAGTIGFDGPEPAKQVHLSSECYRNSN